MLDLESAKLKTLAKKYLPAGVQMNLISAEPPKGRQPPNLKFPKTHVVVLDEADHILLDLGYEVTGKLVIALSATAVSDPHRGIERLLITQLERYVMVDCGFRGLDTSTVQEIDDLKLFQAATKNMGKLIFVKRDEATQGLPLSIQPLIASAKKEDVIEDLEDPALYGNISSNQLVI